MLLTADDNISIAIHMHIYIVHAIFFICSSPLPITIDFEKCQLNRFSMEYMHWLQYYRLVAFFCCIQSNVIWETSSIPGMCWLIQSILWTILDGTNSNKSILHSVAVFWLQVYKWLKLLSMRMKFLFKRGEPVYDQIH